jgi:putative addiction module antidote
MAVPNVFGIASFVQSKALIPNYNARYNYYMTTKLKITTVGNSAGIVLPKDILERLRVGKGDMLFATETPDGVELRAYDPEFAEQMDIAERVMREDRDVLRKLAE